ncbi:MAG: GNAT family N-acetyltransferase [bacterium]|nr:GNAT family N-acetyltransferase [bacterium]
MISFEILKKYSSRDLADINRLIPQIAEKPHLLSPRELQCVLNEGAHCNLVIARDQERKRIAGMAAVTFARVPTGLLAMVEDVVVDSDYRGMGIGAKLTKQLISLAKKRKAKHVSLTTNPARTAANAMYKKLGFFLKETNYYRINLHLPKPNLVRMKSEKH